MVMVIGRSNEPSHMVTFSGIVMNITTKIVRKE
jgi:hypothetical protein